MLFGRDRNTLGYDRNWGENQPKNLRVGREIIAVRNLVKAFLNAKVKVCDNIVDIINIDDQVLVKELVLLELQPTSHEAVTREDNNGIILDENVPTVADYVSLQGQSTAGVSKEDTKPAGRTCGVCEAVFTRKDPLKHGTREYCVCQICAGIQTSKRNFKLHSQHAAHE